MHRTYSLLVAKPGLELGQQLSPFLKLLSRWEGAFPAPPTPFCLSPSAAPVLLWFLLFVSPSPQTGNSLRAALGPATFLGPPSPVAQHTIGARVVILHEMSEQS